ncbi:MAG: ribosomal protein [Arthrobacter sp.]|nr:ribosomal protein [Arthrobacter sp.]
MVVGVHHLVAAGGLQGAGSQLGEDLVGVHVRGRAGAGLENIDGEVAVVLARGHLIGSLRDRLGQLAVEHAQFCVGLGSCLLDPGQCLNVGTFQGFSGDREVLDCTLRLRAVQGVHGDADFAHGVMFNAELFSGSHGASLG